MLDPPGYNPYDKLNESNILTPEHLEVSLRASTEAIVLLKNDRKTLPLNGKSIKAMCVIGPNANNTANIQGDYGPNPPWFITPLQGLTSRMAKYGKKVYYKQGCNDVRCPSLEPVDDILRLCDVAVVVLGLDGNFEWEGTDRSSLALPGLQEHLAMEAFQSGVTTIVALVNAGALTINKLQLTVPAIVETWYGDQFAGEALANVLFGDYSPSGRLPTTWYLSENDLPAITNFTMAGRTYRYHNGPVLYPFGFGLSYSQFAYGQLELNTTEVKVCSGLRVRVTVLNIGDVLADEVVQFYVSDLQAPVRVPIRQLQGFKKVKALEPGERRQVEFELTARQMAIMREGDYVEMVVPGKRSIWVGGGQPNTLAPGQPAAFSVVGPSTPLSQC